MSERRLTVARLTEILRRQRPPMFGASYEPSIKAIREEAPIGSRPATVFSTLVGRDIHTLSGPERAVLVIVLCLPGLFDLQEERMLPFLPAPHPLDGHPLAAGLELKRFRGTLAVAADLNHLSFHPFITTKIDGVEQDVPGCWIGDILGFFKDRNGPYCVNFNIKATRKEFTTPSYGVTVKTNLAKASAQNTARHEVEKQLYAEIDVPTIEVAADELPEILVANLTQLLLWQPRKNELHAEQTAVVLEAFNKGLDRGATPLEVMSAVELTHGIAAYAQKIVLMHGIFSRKVRVDLFECHFFVDKPMLPEQQDVLAVFAPWFRRAT